MTDNAGPRGYECIPVFQIVTREICSLVLKLHNPMINCCTRWAKKYNTAHRKPQFIIGLHNFIIGFHNFSSGYAIVPGHKFHGCQFKIQGYTRTVRGLCGLTYIFVRTFIISLTNIADNQLHSNVKATGRGKVLFNKINL